MEEGWGISELPKTKRVTHHTTGAVKVSKCCEYIQPSHTAAKVNIRKGSPA